MLKIKRCGGNYRDTRAVLCRLALNWVSGLVFLFGVRLCQIRVAFPSAVSTKMDAHKSMGSGYYRTIRGVA